MSVFEGVMLLMQVGACVASSCKGQSWRAVYWLGAFVITLAVVRGMK